MKAQSPTSERGQALVLIVLGMVALLGFTALAVDGGMVYADRRQAQNVADAASLAGGGMAARYMEDHTINYENWDCDGNIQAVINAAEDGAIDRAASNDLSMATSGENRVEATCHEEDKGGWKDKYLDISTWVTLDTRTSFIHFVFGGQVRNSVEAQTRVRPRVPLAFGHAIVAVNEDESCTSGQGVQFGGDSQTSVNGGGVFSNGCLDGDGTAFSTSVTNGGINYVGDLGDHTSGHMTPDPSPSSEPLPPSAYSIPMPDCNSLTPRTQGHLAVLQPGRYSQITLNNGTLDLQPGLYCLDGSPTAMKVTGGELLTAHGVTIVALRGSVEITGGDVITLEAPEFTPDPAPAVPGILFYLPETNHSVVKLTGNGASTYLGTILAPGSDVNIIGTNDTSPTFNTQIIGLNVSIFGNATIDINFNGLNKHTRPTSLELYR